ncbi:acyltransferase family protein, partial [Echinicola sediminis]
MKKLGYVPSLDGLRGLAIIFVLLTHANFQLGKNGIIGVDIFFVLSGFLITTLILEELNITNNFSYKAFYVRRFFRLVPALIFLLLIVSLYAFLFTSGEVTTSILEEIIASLFYFYNISWVWGFGGESTLLAHTWSLAVEEQFYMAWPIILLILVKRMKILNMIILISFFVLVSLILKFEGFASAIYQSILHESILLGVLAALWRWHFNSVKMPNYFIVLSIAILVYSGVFPSDLIRSILQNGSRALFGLVTSILILTLLHNPAHILAKCLSNELLVRIGKISYALYLWHVPVFKWFHAHSTLRPYQSFILKFVLSFFLAVISWYLIERKFLKMGKKISE